MSLPSAARSLEPVLSQRNPGPASALLLLVAMLLSGSELIAPRLGETGIAVLYPPVAFLFLAIFQLRRWRDALWPTAAFVLALIVLILLYGNNPLAASPIIALDIVEAAILASLYRRIIAGRLGPRHPVRAFTFVAVTVAVVLLTGGVAALLLENGAPDSGFPVGEPWRIWRDWSMAQATTYLSAGTVLILLSRQRYRGVIRLLTGRVLEFICAVAFLAFAVTYDFQIVDAIGTELGIYQSIGGTPHPALLFLTLPAVMWLALRFRLFGAMIGIALTTFPALQLVAAGYGPEWLHTVADRVLVMQAYIVVSALTAYLVAALSTQAARERAMVVIALRRAARSSRDRADFLTGLNHELRTPLNGVLGLAHLLRVEGAGPMPPNAQRWAMALEAAAARLQTLVERALNVGKARGLADVGRERPSQPVVIATGVAERLDAMAQIRGVAVSVAFPDDLTARTGRSALELMLLNLLSNAIRHAKSRAIITGRSLGTSIEISIEDDGPGFVPDEQRTTKSDDTAALGLHIVETLVAIEGGALTIGTAASGGALVTIRLPAE